MVYDIIFKNGSPVAATPGGSMLNTAVSLGRLGADVYFIGEYGTDKVGETVDDFLRANGVNTDYACRYADYPSSLALAFLDEAGNAEYSFYKQYPENRLDIAFPELTEDDIVLFGSFYGIDPDIHTRLNPFLEHARSRNALVIYDPNFRKSHPAEPDKYRPIIMSNFASADIVKGSDEDFAYIFGVASAEAALDSLRGMCDTLIYTANKNNVRWLMPGTDDSCPVPPLTPVSTVGAGDTFNAGLIYGLLSRNITKDNLKTLPAEQRASIIREAIGFAGQVCMSYDNYISREFADEICGLRPTKAPSTTTLEVV